MRWVLGGIAVCFAIGGGIVGFFFWMLANDGVGDESTMKLLGGTLMAAGLLVLGGLIVAALTRTKP